MEEDEEIDLELATDEESKKILKLENELASIGSLEDKKLFSWLGVGLIFILAYAIKPSVITQYLVIIATPVSLIGGIGRTIYNNIKNKRSVLVKYGLQCPSCGFVPRTLNASGVLSSKKCLKCHSNLNS